MTPDMLEWVSRAGTLGLAFLFLYLFQANKIRSDKQVTEMVAMYSQVIEGKDREIIWWREAYKEQVARGDKLEVINGESLELSRTALAVLNGVQAAAKKVSSDDE